MNYVYNELCAQHDFSTAGRETKYNSVPAALFVHLSKITHPPARGHIYHIARCAANMRGRRRRDRMGWLSPGIEHLRDLCLGA